MVGRLLLGIALALVLPVTASAQETSPDPYQLFARAHEYWQTQHYPALVEYDVAVDIAEGGSIRTERYRSAYDGVEGTVGIDPISDYERAHPASGSGVNLGFLFWQLNKPQAPVDFLGVPMLAPAYTFGMGAIPRSDPAHRPTDAELVAEIRAQFHDPNPRATPTPVPALGPPPIATVVAFKRDYRIALAGREPIDGHDCYHLTLQPTRDPGRFRLRDLWIDDHGAPWQLREALNFVDGPGTNVPWTVHFRDIDGAHYVSEEDADAPIATRGLLYAKTAVRIDNLRPVDRLDFRPVSNDFLPSNLLQEP